MKLFRLYSVFFFVSLAFSCAKKKYPESVVLNDAVYLATYSADGNQVEMKAGVDGYYLYSGIEQDSNKVYNFISDLRKADCLNCPLALKIQINDYKASDINGPVNIDSSLIPKPYAYLPPNANAGCSVSFVSSYNRTDQGAIYNWSFGDGQVSALKDPVHTYTMGGTYEVCLTIKGSNSCVSSVCTKVRVVSGGFNTTILGTTFGGNSVSFSQVTTGGFGPYDYLWNFGDGQTAFTQSASHNYAVKGSYAVTLRIIDAHGDTAFAYYNAVTKTDLSSCAANIGPPVINPSSSYQFELSKIKLSFTDETGAVYQSDRIAQPQSSIFEIISVELGDRNEKGEITKKLHVRFSCKVANGSKVKTIDHGDAIIGVAYK